MKCHEGKEFFLTDYDDEKRVTTWTRDRRKTVPFKNLEVLRKFHTRYMNGRKDIMIVMI